MAFIDTLKGLSLRNKMIAGAAGVASLVLLALVAQGASRPAMALLYAGLDQKAAGEIITRLDAENVAYDVQGDRILVSATERDRLRLVLAQEGLPDTSVAGYEILDGLSGFSTTSDMFSAAYWRAKEGELTRTILTMPGVRAARVHIGNSERSVFSHRDTERSASVTVTAPGGLDHVQVEAIQHLTALAVTGMKPADVAVIDTKLGLMSRDPSAAGGAALDEDRRALALEKELTRLLEARVGRGNARVSVAMELSREMEAISEETIDPDSAIVMNRTVSEMREEEVGRNAPVTIASDLPDGDADQPGEEQAMNRNEARESVEYAVSRRARTVERLPGDINRMTIAVLINQPTAADGGAADPRSAEEIESLRLLVENAAGLNADRGDRITIQSLPFEPPAEIDMAGGLPVLDAVEPQLWRLAQLGILGGILVVLGLFVVRPILTQTPPESAAIGQLEQFVPATDDPITMLRHASEEKPDAAAALLNAWLEEEESA